MEPESYSFSRYLSAKRSVDERALNRRVYDEYITRLAEHGRSQSNTLEILEVAGGVGHTAIGVLKSLSNGGLSAVDYTLVDIDPDLVAAAREHLSNWGREEGFDVQDSDGRVVLEGEARTVSVLFVTGDAFEVLADTPASTYDAVIAQAWLDLVSVETALERIFRVLSDEGLFYAPIHYDGVTRFLPIVEEALERTILELYHQSMDERETPHGPAGGSRTGTRLLTEVPRGGGRIEAAGASDWIVWPQEDSCYPADEKYFLRHVLHVIEDELESRSEMRTERFERWLSRRRSQIRNGELRFLAHQLDILARKRR